MDYYIDKYSLIISFNYVPQDCFDGFRINRYLGKALTKDVVLEGGRIIVLAYYKREDLVFIEQIIEKDDILMLNHNLKDDIELFNVKNEKIIQ